MSGVLPWRKKHLEQLADCRVFTVQRAVTESPFDGSEHDFFLIDSCDWVNLVPITENNEVVCIEQFRHGTDEITLEIPGGMVDPGEEPELAAIRECLEETGYRAESAESLGVLSPNPALFPNHLHTYLARNVKLAGDVKNTAREQTRVRLIPIRDLPDLLTSGAIDHALVAATLWRMFYIKGFGDD